jgi:hypothetical protein
MCVCARSVRVCVCVCVRRLSVCLCVCGGRYYDEMFRLLCRTNMPHAVVQWLSESISGVFESVRSSSLWRRIPGGWSWCSWRSWMLVLVLMALMIVLLLAVLVVLVLVAFSAVVWAAIPFARRREPDKPLPSRPRLQPSQAQHSQ